MKVKITIFILCFLGQFCFAQTLSSKALHGMVVNDSIKIQSGYVLNLTSRSSTSINEQGFFDVIAKTKDTLIFSSFGLKSKKVILTKKDFESSVFVVKLDTQVDQLDEVVIRKQPVIKANLGDTQKIVNNQYADDKQSSLDNSVVHLRNGVDLVKVSEMVWKLFFKSADETKDIESSTFSEVVIDKVNHKFLTNTLQLKEDQIGLFLIYCENDPKAKELLKPDSEFEMIDFLIVKNEEFKKNLASGK